MGLNSDETPYDKTLGDRTASDPDNIETVLPNAGIAWTGEFHFGSAQSKLEIEIFTDVEITVPDAGSLAAELFWYAETGGVATGSRTINVFAPTGETAVIEAGGTIGLIVPETDVDMICKVKFETSFDASTATASTKIYPTV